MQIILSRCDARAHSRQGTFSHLSMCGHCVQWRFTSIIFEAKLFFRNVLSSSSSISACHHRWDELERRSKRFATIDSQAHTRLVSIIRCGLCPVCTPSLPEHTFDSATLFALMRSGYIGTYCC